MGNPLVAFALVAEEYERSGDPVLGLKPLFAPLLAGKHGQPFDADLFASDFTNTYGLAMSPFVARALRDRLVATGLLERYSNAGADAYHVSMAPLESYDFDEKQIDETVSVFVRWATHEVERLSRTASEKHLEEAFLSRLARPGFASIFLEEDSETRAARLSKLLGRGGVDRDVAGEEFLDYLVARFILTTCDTAPEVFTAISSIAYGSLVADAVAGLAVPGQSDMPDPPLRVVLDGPILLDLLDLNTSAHREYAEGLIELLRSANLRLATFDHIVEEMRGSIRATLAAYAAKNAYGPLAERIRHNKDHRLYATAVVDSLEDRIKALGIVVMRGEVYEEARYKRHFTDDALDRIRNAIGDVHHQLERRIKDAKSVALVARLKGDNQSPSSVLKAGTIFITRNSALCSRVNQALSVGRSEPRPRFAIATDGQIAGILWFVLGSGGLEMSRRRLIANCASAVLPRREVVARISALLTGMDPRLGDEFEALMRDGRASLCPMRITGGFSDVVDEEMSLNILSSMKQELVAPVKEEAIQQQEHAAEIVENLGSELLQTKHAVVILQDAVEVEVGKQEAQKAGFDSQLAQVQYELELARSNEEETRAASFRREAELAKRVQTAQAAVDLKVEQLLRRIRWLAYGGIGLATIAALFSESLALKVAAAFAAVCCLPFVSKWFDNHLINLARWQFRKESRVIGQLFGSPGE